MTSASAGISAANPAPWWRVGTVWLVLGGPAAVVMACIVTFTIALRGAEPVLTSKETDKFSERPAVQGRNHSAAAPGKK
jgi:uncharacterized protein